MSKKQTVLNDIKNNTDEATISMYMEFAIVMAMDTVFSVPENIEKMKNLVNSCGDDLAKSVLIGMQFSKLVHDFLKQEVK